MSQSRIFVGMVLILIFAEVLGLYGYACTARPTKLDTNLAADSLSPLFSTPEQVAEAARSWQIVRLAGVETVGRACNIREFTRELFWAC